MGKQTNFIQKFHSDEFGSLEVLSINGKPYFPAVECAKILGYKNPHDAVLKHCRGDLAFREVTDKLGRLQEKGGPDSIWG